MPITSLSEATQLIQWVNTQTGAVATGSTVMPDDDTIPQITEGNEYMTLAITPTNAANTLLIDVVINFSCNYDEAVMLALFQDATAGALAAETVYATSTGNRYTTHFTHKMTAGTTSATTFRVRVGASTAGTITFNGYSAGRRLGGVMASSITIREVR